MKDCPVCKCFFKINNVTRGQKSCSVKCGNILKKVPKPNRRTGKLINCVVCSKSIYVQKCRLHEKRFCSRECQYDHLRKTNEWGLPKSPNPIKSNPYVRKMINKKSNTEHRTIMEYFLGRKLKRNEHVHHINGNPKDNRIENLEIKSPNEHAKLHYEQYSK